MKKILFCLTLLFSSCILAFMFMACGDEPIDSSDSSSENRGEMKFKRTLLLYAIASNNLYSSFQDDMDEILKGAPQCDLNSCSFLVYAVGYTPEATLYELIKDNDNNYSLDPIQKYDRDVYSTDPRRLSAVISDMKRLRVADKYGLILWSHGTGWSQSETVHPALSEDDKMPVISYSFGLDSYNSKNDYMNIDELAKAIPSDVFDYIWFDACYMSGIETIYQLRDKCETMIGYPTEVWSTGMPYDQTLPLLLKPQPNLVGAAELFSDYYSNTDMSWTIAVIRMSTLPDLADAAREVYKYASGPAYSSLIKYSRPPCGPFYDFGQMTMAFKSDSEEPEKIEAHSKALAKFEEALDNAIIYKSSSPYNFNYPGYGVIRDEWAIDQEAFSGINCRYFKKLSDINDPSGFYQSLDWFRDVLTPSAGND